MGHKRHGVPEVPAVTIHHPCVLSGARRYASARVITTPQHCLLTGTSVLFYLCKTIASRSAKRSACIFFLAWLASFGVIGSSIVRSTPHEVKACLRSTGFRRHLSGYRLRSAGFRRHLSAPTLGLRPTRFRLDLSGSVCARRGSDVIYHGRPPAVYAFRCRRHLSESV